MHFMRIFSRHRALAMILVMIALSMKVFVPAGYMVEQGATGPVVRICSSGLDAKIVRPLELPARRSQQDAPGQQSKDECPFSVLSIGALGAADPFIAALALAFIVALGFAPTRTPVHRRLVRLRPPLRGPPILT